MKGIISGRLNAQYPRVQAQVVKNGGVVKDRLDFYSTWFLPYVIILKISQTVVQDPSMSISLIF